MNRLLPLVGVAVLVAALTGAAIGWGGLRFPFLGRRASNQLDTAQNRQSSGTQILPANQPNSTAQNNQSQRLGANQPATTAQNNQALDTTADTSGAAAQSDASQTVPALW
ncbi:MAG: hypothetical protein WA828_12545 [Coleofasciculaceae cyanobacterium]